MKLILLLLLNLVNGGFDLPGYAQKGRSRHLVPPQRKVSEIRGQPNADHLLVKFEKTDSV